MSQFDSNKDYYGVLGVDKHASQRDIDREYKRQAAKHHPDRGGNEEQMKSVNEAYGVLKDVTLRRAYDDSRTTTRAPNFSPFAPVSTPSVRDIGVMGQVLSAVLCLGSGLFLLLLLMVQWIWFLWPLAVLALLIIGFGVLLARGAMVAAINLLPVTNRLKRHTKLQELAFWMMIGTSGYGLLYLLLSYWADH
ncbi:MAG TPA: DnaJ domain-containing protein [Pyrinomonadaceae bacterium]|nr:DnaJ domain-containing protein [Pyrinomonadaceae bacterium]